MGQRLFYTGFNPLIPVFFSNSTLYPVRIFFRPIARHIGIRHIQQYECLFHTPGRIPRTGGNQGIVKEEGRLLQFSQEIHMPVRQGKFTLRMGSYELVNASALSIPAVFALRHKSPHNRFHMRSTVIPCSRQYSAEAILGNQRTEVLYILSP